MDANQLIEAVNPKECLDFLARMVRFKSYSNTSGETDVARFMVAEMSKLGVSAELQHVEAERYNAIGTWQGTGGGRSLMFNGHMDTNPATEGWTVDPWGGLYDDEFIYGIGVSNMKAADAAFFCAVKTLIDRKVTLKGDVVLTYVVGELQGGVGTLKMIEKGVRADCFINGEPTDLNGLALHAGGMSFRIELIGNTRHVSKREEAVDANAAACALLPRINQLELSGAAHPDHAAVNRAHVGIMRGSLSSEFHDWRSGQVADFAHLIGTGRFGPSQSQETVLADLRRLTVELEKEFPGLETRVGLEGAGQRQTMLPFEADRDSEIVRTVARAYERVRGEKQRVGPIAPYCYYGSDAAHLQHLAGMPGIVCGPGGKYNTMPDERVDIPDYLDAVKIYMLSILDVCHPA